ncbi:uncharacterized protein LOC132062452 [Lycium ferocissimum]|uniref:uncharacterized protein LOC132062452 n=1 Tax=Lycium ferocissimum TaxID=112874 RepID=UPI00281667B2|nr:uncharacterized protein LOC132062452 [Lycium ferocissimum]
MENFLEKVRNNYGGKTRGYNPAKQEWMQRRKNKYIKDSSGVILGEIKEGEELQEANNMIQTHNAFEFLTTEEEGVQDEEPVTKKIEDQVEIEQKQNSRNKQHKDSDMEEAEEVSSTCITPKQKHTIEKVSQSISMRRKWRTIIKMGIRDEREISTALEVINTQHEQPKSGLVGEQDLDKHSIEQNMQAVARAGDLSPKQVDKAMGRDDMFEVKIVVDHPQLLTLNLKVQEQTEEMLISIVYAKCTQTERMELWEALEDQSTTNQRPWMIGGDFNVITSEEDKYGGLPLTWALKEANILSGMGKVEMIAEFMANPLNLFHHKLKNVKTALATWSKVTFGNIFQEIETLKEMIKVHEIQFELQSTPTNRESLHKVQADLNRYLHLEEKFWKQKGGMNWFKDGDRNTTSFHAYVQGRRKRLQLKRIQNQEGNWLENQEEISQEAIRFFSAQFTKDENPTDFEILDHIPQMIFEEQSTSFGEIPSEDEVKRVVFSLNGESAPGPNSFTGIFYQSCWEIIIEDIINMAGFVKGRSIAENVLLPQEIISDNRLRTKSANVVMKLDMAKAYDRVSWIFLMKVQRKLVFQSWGVKQGDPLSPTLFILTVEVLSRNLNALNLIPQFKGYGMPNWSPKVNHLSYVDDMIIFSSEYVFSLQLIMEGLKKYENTFG